MAKKNKRQSRKTVSIATPSPSTFASPTGSRTFDRDFNPDYTPVVNDLKRIATLAGSFLIILVVLSFILR